MKPESKKILAALLVSAFTFIVFLPALKNGFVSYDDNLYVYENPGLGLTGAEFLRWLSTAVVVANWHPVTMLSLAIDFKLWGADPFWFHLENIIIHSANAFLAALLFFRLARRLEINEKQALVSGVIASLLFGIHPMRVESVVWISERKDVLCAFFFLLSAYAYTFYAEDGRRRHYFACLAFFAFSLLSKSMAVTLPLALIILDFFPYGRITGFRSFVRATYEKAPFFLLSAAAGIAALYTQKTTITDYYTAAERALYAIHSYIFYIYKTVLPLKLSPYYQRPGEFVFGPTHAAAIGAFAAITAFCLFSLKKQKAYAAAWAYFCVTLAPVIGIVQVAYAGTADRYSYIPGIGLFFLIGAGAGRMITGASKTDRVVSIAAFTLLTVLLSAMTASQTGIWKDDISLWSRAIETYPSSFAYYNRCGAYINKGQEAKAIEDCSNAIKVSPRYDKPYYNRALAYGNLGEFGKAASDLSAAIDISKDDPSYYLLRGSAYMNMARPDLALDDFRAASRLRPGDPGVREALARAYEKTGYPRKPAPFLDTPPSHTLK